MEIIQKDFKRGVVRFKVSDLDDLWYLSQIIEAGDLLRGKSTRKVKIGEQENAKVVKKTIYLTIEVETIDLDIANLSLRLNGKNKEETTDVAKDSYHSIALELSQEYRLQKPLWQEYQKQKLQEASQKSYLYLICLFDREEAIFALTKKFGYEILVELKGEVEKKRDKNNVKTQFFPQLIQALQVYNDRHAPQAIILASPAFYKDDLAKKITNENLKRKIVLSSCSSVSQKALDEVITRPELAKTIQNSRAREEHLLMSSLLKEIDKNNLAAYGEKEVYQAIEKGAVQSLLLTDEFMVEKKSKGDFNNLNEKMRHVDTLKGEIHLLSSQMESGQKLNGLGGIAAILRFKLDW